MYEGWSEPRTTRQRRPQPSGIAAMPYLMMEWLQYPRSEEEVLERLSDTGRSVKASTPKPFDASWRLRSCVGPCLPDGGLVKIRPRVHRFLRGLARFWRCTNASCGKLLGEGIGECDQCGSKSLPLALCRTCGWDFFVAVQPDEDQALQPWTWRRSTKDTLFLYDPPKSRVEVDPEVDAFGSEDDDEPVTAEPDDDGTETEDRPTQLGLFDRNLDPTNLRLRNAGENGRPGTEDLLRPVLLHKGRGTRCPVCSSRYGSADILTPVSLGNSSALTRVARVLMNGLPPDQRKLLVFCDSRQDTAHQARFVEASEERVGLRRRCILYSNASRSHTTWSGWLTGYTSSTSFKDGSRSRRRRTKSSVRKTGSGVNFWASSSSRPVLVLPLRKWV